MRRRPGSSCSCRHGSARPALLLPLFLVILLLATSARAQRTRTDPVEAAAVNAVFAKLGQTAAASSLAWNISGEPCTGAATDGTFIDDVNFNPAITCECSGQNNTICHVTGLKIYALNVVGQIPEELRNLTRLTNLDLRQNYLTGPLPSFLGELTEMQYMALGINALSGSVPKELGKLLNLVSLGIGSNYLNGYFPSELGNLDKLEQLYIDSAGLSGPLPSSLSRLTRMKTLWASDNDFTGKIPDYIGSWTNLTELRHAMLSGGITTVMQHSNLNSTVESLLQYHIVILFQ